MFAYHGTYRPALYADGQYVGVHAASDGLKVIHLPGQFRVCDAISDKPVGSDDPNVTLSMKRAQTMLLRLGARRLSS